MRLLVWPLTVWLDYQTLAALGLGLRIYKNTEIPKMNAVATAEAFAAPDAEIGFESDQGEAKLFSTRGRMGVLKYAAQALIWTLAFGLVVAAIMAVTAALGSGEESMPIAMGIGGIAALPFFFLMVCLAVKRAHDLNMSGWFLLLTAIPVVGSIFGLYLMLWPGKAEANRFGAQVETKGWEKVVGGIYIALMVALTAFMVFGLATGGLALLMQP